MTAQRDSRGRFGSGARGNPKGRPKLTEQEIAARGTMRVIEERTPALIAHAIGRAEQDDAVLAGLCHLLAEQVRAQNIQAETALLNGRSHKINVAAASEQPEVAHG